MKNYDIRPEWHPIMPSKKNAAFPLRNGQIMLFADFFNFFYFRLPITKFCKEMLDEYAMHISHIHLLGLAKLRHFEYASLSLGVLPEKLIFRAFYTRVWKAPFFTFDRRSTDESCLRLVPSSSRDKDWRKKFFFIDADVIPGGMHWRTTASKENVKDVDPAKGSTKRTRNTKP
ncbi:hypothetical protein Hanom_Chr00s000650g01653421 [Helianthus anomalus]